VFIHVHQSYGSPNSPALVGMQVMCVHGVYCGARINYKSKSTAQNVLGVKRKFKKKLYNIKTDSHDSKLFAECENDGVSRWQTRRH